MGESNDGVLVAAQYCRIVVRDGAPVLQSMHALDGTWRDHARIGGGVKVSEEGELALKLARQVLEMRKAAGSGAFGGYDGEG